MRALQALPLLLVVLVFAGCNDLSLPEASLGSVKGKVVARPDARPLADIEVRLVTSTGSRLTQRTDAAGAFAFASVSPGVHAIEVRLDTYAPEVVLGVAVARGQEADVGTITLTPLAAEAVLSGRVVAQGGGSLDGARVEFIAQATQQRLGLTTVGEDGAFTQRLAPGTYTLRATHPLYVSATREDLVVHDGVNDVTAEPLSLALNPATLSGRVLRHVTMQGADPSLPQVLVTLGTGQTTTTDATGHFQLTGLAGGATTVRFSLANFVDAERAVTLVPGQAATLSDVTLEGRVGSIEGTVELSDQQPVQDVMVSISGTPFSTLAVPDPLVQGRGTFRLDNVPNGTWEVTATRTRYSRAVASGIVITDLAPVANAGTLRLTLLVGDFRIDDGDPGNADGFTRRQHVTLQLAAFAGADDFRASEDQGFADAGWQPLLDVNRPFDLAPAEGAHTVYAQYRRQGATSPTFQSSVVLDSTPPSTASIGINGGATYTNFGASLALELDAVDSSPTTQTVSGVGGMRVALSNTTQALDAGVFLVGATVPWTRQYTFPLPPRADGPVQVWAQFIDNAGNPSAIVSSTITLDRLEPQSPSLRIRDGAQATSPGFTNTPFVELEHSADADGGVVLIALANSSAGLGVATFGALTPTSAWVLDPGGADTKTVWARFRDEAGNQTAPVQAQIIYDPAPPSPVSATLLSGTPARDAGVTLQLSATDTHGLSPTAALTISEDPLFQTALVGPQAMPPTGQQVVQLPPGDGARQLFVRFTDRAGNSASTSVRLTLDTQTPTGAFTVGSGAAIQVGTSFPVTFTSVSDDVTGLYLAASASAPNCDAVTYGTFQVVNTLPLSDGTRSVYACLRDLAGNRALVGPVTVMVDNVAPTISGVTLSGLSAPAASLTNTLGLALQLAGLADATSGVSEVRVSTDSSFAGVAFAPLNGGAVVGSAFSLPYTLPAGDGPRSVYVQVRDRAGLTSSTVQANLTLDTQPPAWASTGVASAWVATATGALVLAATDNLDTQAQLQVATSLSASGCAAASYVAFNAALPSPALSAGPNTFFVCLMDRAGNRAAPVALSVFRIGTPPQASSLVVNPPLPLASGALVSWTDANPYPREIEIDASLDPTFATGVRTYRSGRGDCAVTGLTPPPTFARIGLGAGEQRLTNLRNWYLRLRSVDCAGTPSANVVVLEADNVTPRPVTPNLSATLVGETLPGAQLFVDGDRLWVHGPDATAFTRAEQLRTCRVSVADCRDPASWRTLSVPLTLGAVADSANAATMFSTDGVLYLAEAVASPGFPSNTWSFAMTSCARSTDCSVAANWSVGNPPGLPGFTGMSAVVGGATSSTLGLFAVANNPLWGFDYLTMLRCDRSRGVGCRSLSGWTLVQTAITLDRSRGLTLATNDSQFLIGGVSSMAWGLSSTGPDSGNQPMLVKCEGLCAAGGSPAGFCNGGMAWPPDPMPPACGCDGQTCGDFRFSRLDKAPASAVMFSTKPSLVATSGQVTAVWADRRCVAGVCTDAIRSSTCVTGDCQYGTSYTPAAAPVAQWAMPGTNAQLPRVKAVIGGGQEVAESVRALYTTDTGAGFVASCTTSSTAPCFNSPVLTRITNDESASLQVAAIGTNLYALGARPLGDQVLWQPFVPTPSQVVVGPTTTGLEVSWTAWPSATRTDVDHALPDGGSPARLSLADPFVASATLSTAQPRQATATFGTSNGVGDPSRVFEATPFRAVTGPTLSGDQSVSVSAPGSTSGGNDYVYASAVTPTGLSLGRCNTTGDCAQAANWAWNAVDTGTFSWTQLSVDYPRAFSFGGTFGAITHTTPRLFVVGSSGADNAIYLYGCVLTTPTACAAPAQFTRVSLSSNSNQVGALRAVGDRVSLVLTNGAAPVVKYCDGSASTVHDVCSGPGTTNRALDYCFNAANWKTVTLSTGPLMSAWGKATGAPHPTWGWMVLVPRPDNGVVLWSCPFGTMTSSCGASVNDCSSLSNWRSSKIDTDVQVDSLDLDFAVGQYHPTRGISDQSAAVYVSWSSASPGTTWGISQCKVAPSPHYGSAWPCVADDGSSSDNARFARAWSSTSVASLPGEARASTVRSVGGDVVASFSTDSRVYLTRCSGGFDCMRRSSWNTYSPGPLQLGQAARAVLAGGKNGELYVGGAVGTTSTFFSGGRFISR